MREVRGVVHLLSYFLELLGDTFLFSFYAIVQKDDNGDSSHVGSLVQAKRPFAAPSVKSTGKGL